ncbi:MAG TPA: MFS transporter, partial [Umezawaea sp.]|nr:MFS transporter [Umezawaea sp.]
VNAPVGVVVFVLGLLALGPSERRDTGRFDGAGLVLSAVGFTGVMLALTRGASGGWGEPVVWIAGVVGVGALAALVRVELTAGSPLIDVRLLGRGTFRTMSLAILLLTAGYLGVQYTFPLLYQTALGHTAFVTGLLTLPLPVGIVVGAQVAPALGRRLGLRRALVTAYLTFAAGSLLLGLNGAGSVEAVIVAEMFCLGVAQAVGFNLAQAAMFQDVSGERTGSASSVFNVTLQVGGALGVALLSGVLAVAGPVREDGLPDVAAHQASAMAVAVWAVAAAAVVAFSRRTGTATPAPAEERGTASA